MRALELACPAHFWKTAKRRFCEEARLAPALGRPVLYVSDAPALASKNKKREYILRNKTTTVAAGMRSGDAGYRVMTVERTVCMLRIEVVQNMNQCIVIHGSLSNMKHCNQL